MKLGIVGSRNFNDYTLFCKTVDQFLREWDTEYQVEQVISGGATGADKLAEQWATDHDYSMKFFLPDWKAYGKAAGPMRNQQIIDHCTHLIAFPSVKGRGTQDSLKRAKKAGRKVKVLWCDVDPKN